MRSAMLSRAFSSAEEQVACAVGTPPTAASSGLRGELQAAARVERATMVKRLSISVLHGVVSGGRMGAEADIDNPLYFRCTMKRCLIIRGHGPPHQHGRLHQSR